MGRDWTERIVDYPALAPGTVVCGCVAGLEKVRELQAVRVSVALLDSEQAGRTLTFLLPLPIRTQNPAGAFFRGHRHDHRRRQHHQAQARCGGRLEAHHRPVR